MSKCPFLLFVNETKLKTREFNYRFNFRNLPDRFVVEAVGRHGGLVLFWAFELNIEAISYSSSHIEVFVLDEFSNRNGDLWVFMETQSVQIDINHGNSLISYAKGIISLLSLAVTGMKSFLHRKKWEGLFIFIIV